MAQATNLVDGVPLAGDFDTADVAALLRALITEHSGAVRPDIITAEGEGVWTQKLNETTWYRYYYDGSQDNLLGTLNPITHTWTPAGNIGFSFGGKGSGSGSSPSAGFVGSSTINLTQVIQAVSLYDGRIAPSTRLLVQAGNPRALSIGVIYRAELIAVALDRFDVLVIAMTLDGKLAPANAARGAVTLTYYGA